jgi:hypothetical protein
MRYHGKLPQYFYNIGPRRLNRIPVLPARKQLLKWNRIFLNPDRRPVLVFTRILLSLIWSPILICTNLEIQTRIIWSRLRTQKHQVSML